MNQSINSPQINFNNLITKLYCYDYHQFLEQLKLILKQLQLEQINLDFDYEENYHKYAQNEIDQIKKYQHIDNDNFGDNYYIKSFKLTYQDLSIIATKRNDLLSPNLITKLLTIQNQLKQPIAYHTNDNNLVFYQSATAIGHHDLNYNHCDYDGKLILKLQLPIRLDQIDQNQIQQIIGLCQTLQDQLVDSNQPGLKGYRQEHLLEQLDDDILGVRIQFNFDHNQNLAATQYEDFEHQDYYYDCYGNDYFSLIKPNSPLQTIKKLQDFNWSAWKTSLQPKSKSI